MDSTDTTTDPSPVAPATCPAGFKDSLPIVLSYVPVAFVFRLNATNSGFTPLKSVFLSCITVFSIPVATLVGSVNCLFRFLPLRLHVGKTRPVKRGVSGVLLDIIGIASLCALRMVSGASEVFHDSRRLRLPTLFGFIVVGLSFWKTRSIIIPGLLSALAYGIT